MYNNIMWGQTGPLDINKCTDWSSKEFLDLHWIFLEITNQLIKYKISDYMIIIVEHANHNLLDNLSLFVQKNIIVVQTDHLHHNSLLRQIEFTSNENYSIPFLISNTILNFISAANKHLDKNIIFYSLVANLTRETDQLLIPKNLIIKHLGIGNLFHKSVQYKNSPVIITKSKDARTFVCLNNNNRPHRMAAVTYLLADDLDKYGYISCINWELDPGAACFLDWCFDSKLHTAIATKIKNGIAKFDNNKLLELPCHEYYLINYNQNLAPLYHNTFIDIVTDTTFFEPSEFLNDKYVNAILGANFPIFIASSGTVAQLRLMGFDVFDDVINHSYDTIVDHAVRLSQAIELNRHLLTNIELISQLWHTHANRFKKNQQYFFNEFRQVVATSMIAEFDAGIVELVRKS